MKKTPKSVFDAEVFLASAGVARKIVEFERKATIFSQGDAAKNVMYIERGAVKLSVVNGVGKEAVVAMLGPGDFFGEGCLAGEDLHCDSDCNDTYGRTRDCKRRDEPSPPYGTCIL